jgi:hypothetical protein
MIFFATSLSAPLSRCFVDEVFVEFGLTRSGYRYHTLNPTQPQILVELLERCKTLRHLALAANILESLSSLGLADF